MPSVGYLLAFCTRRLARAARRLASAACSVWLAEATCGSSVLRSSSWKSVHQLPRGIWSCGEAVCHSAFSPESASGLASLKAGAAGTDGALYLGPTMHQASVRQPISAALRDAG